ncbi:MAG: insulinase family protein [Acidobacteria bacterium]|nr:insulinase family protein [Acidobacteriota bacterium]
MNRKRFSFAGLALLLLAAFAPAAAAQPPTPTTPAAAQTPAPKQTPPEGGRPKPFTLPQRESFKLSKGLSVTLVPYGAIPKVTVRAVTRTGNLDEPAGKTWLADLTGDLLKEGTPTRTAQQISEQAAAMGGSLSVAVGEETTSVGIDVLSEFGADAVALVADVLQRPALPASELERLKAGQIRNLSVARSQPGQLGAQRTHVYVVGVFDAKEMRRAVTAAFDKWAQGAPATENVPKPTSARALHVINRPGATQSTIYLGLPVVDPSHKDYVALMVTDYILGGAFTSRITSNIRENKGYTYSPGSQVSTRFRDAYWVEIADVTTAVTGPSLKEIFHEIERLQKEPPPEAELRGIKNNLAGIFVIQNSSRGGIINQLALLDLHRLPETYLTNFVQNVINVTPADVQRVAREYLRADKMAVVVVGDREKIAEQLKPYGDIVNN